jgi:predicted outer membrane repeat protein
MSRFTWLPWFTEGRSQRDARRSRRRNARHFSLECLEHRTVLSSVTLTVSSLADTGSGTLRAAITAADAGSSNNSYAINFSSGLTGTITLESALPAFSNNISLNGPGAGSLTVQRDPNAASSFGIFAVNSVTASISGLTIAGGTAGNTQGQSGGIYNGGSLTVSNCTLSNNTAGEGGGIFNNGRGSLTVSDCTLENNTAGEGGGLFNYGTVTVSGSTITGNSTVQSLAGPWSPDGGGILNVGTLTVSSSTLTNNTAGTANGGGMALEPGSSTTVDGCTIENNVATSYGGGIFCSGYFQFTYGNGKLTVEYSTVINNGYADLYNQWPAKDVTLVNSDIGIIQGPVTVKNK